MDFGEDGDEDNRKEQENDNNSQMSSYDADLEDEISADEEQLEQSRYEAKLAQNKVRLNLFHSKGDDQFQSLRSSTDVNNEQYDSF